MSVLSFIFVCHATDSGENYVTRLPNPSPPVSVQTKTPHSSLETALLVSLAPGFSPQTIPNSLGTLG